MFNKKSKNREPLVHIVKRTDIPWWNALLMRLAAVLFGVLLVCLLLLIFTGADPFTVFSELVKGCFSSERRIRITFRDLSLLLGTGLALIPAFKMKFWNLGGNGQILMGALASIACMYYMGNAGIPDWVINITMVPCAIIAGIIWAVIPAIFKAYFNTNESLFTLMMNYIAVGIVSVFLSAVVTSGSGTLGDVSTGNLPVLGRAEYLTIIVVSIVLVLVFFYLKFDKHGYELEVVGESQNTAKYVGINVKKVIIRTMVLSGAICGLMGLLIAGSIDHTITTDTAKNLGFTAIMVAWLAKFNPFVMVGTSFIITLLDNGMGQVQSTFGITNDSIADIVVGLVYFSIIAVEFFISYRIVFKKRTPKLETSTNQVESTSKEVKEGK